MSVHTIGIGILFIIAAKKMVAVVSEAGILEGPSSESEVPLPGEIEMCIIRMSWDSVVNLQGHDASDNHERVWDFDEIRSRLDIDIEPWNCILEMVQEPR